MHPAPFLLRNVCTQVQKEEIMKSKIVVLALGATLAFSMVASAWARAAASEGEQAERAAAQPGPAVLQAQVEWEVAALGGEVHLVRHRRI